MCDFLLSKLLYEGLFNTQWSCSWSLMSNTEMDTWPHHGLFDITYSVKCTCKQAWTSVSYGHWLLWISWIHLSIKGTLCTDLDTWSLIFTITWQYFKSPSVGCQALKVLDLSLVHNRRDLYEAQHQGPAII